LQRHQFYHIQTNSTPEPPTSNSIGIDPTLSKWSYSPLNYGPNQNRGYQGRLLCYSLYTIASLSDNPKQRNPKHPGGHQSKKDHENKDTGRSGKGKPGLDKVKTGGLIYAQMPKVTMAITISDDSKSTKEQEPESEQQPDDKQPVVEPDEDKNDKDEDDKD